MKKLLSLILTVVLIITLFPVSAFAGNSEKHWVSAWSTSPVCAGLSELGNLNKVGVLTSNVSSRVTVTPAASGSQVRLVFSNEYGNTPLTISSCTVAGAGFDARIVDTKKLKNVLFNGKRYVTIPAGKTITSDPVKMTVTTGKNISVTTYFKGFNSQRTVGLIGGSSYVSVGDYTHVKSMLTGIKLSAKADSGEYEVIPSLKGIDVLSENTYNCVIFGDSTVANDIPKLLETQLQAKGIKNVSVTQQAIKGNRLLADGVGIASGLLGESGIKRFERDVLNQAGVKYVIVRLGNNDIIHPYCKSKTNKLQPVTFDEMTAAYTKLINMAHQKGIKIYLAELSPWKGYTRNLLGLGDDVQWTAEIDAVRLQVNAWMKDKTKCKADGVLTFPAMANPNDSYALRSEYTTDGVHLTALGQIAFVNAIPLTIFKNK